MHLLRGLSPFGPIFGKELRVAARRRRNYLLRVGYLGGLLLFLLLAWSITHSWSFGQSSVAARAQQQQQLGYYFFAFFSMFCMGAMTLIGPVLTSTAINGERQARTLHVLLMTPITAWQIVSGKLCSRMLTALTLIGLSLPVLALVRLLGGVEIDQMIGVLCLCAATATFGAALGLLLSILLRRAFAVILLAYFIFAIVYFFAPILTAALMPREWQRLPWFHILGAYNPFAAVFLLAWGQMRFLTAHWHVCVLIHLAATGVLLVISANLVRRLSRHEGETIAAPAPAHSLAPLPADAINAPAPAPGLAPLPADAINTPAPPAPSPRQRRLRTVSDHPVLWRELRRPLMTRTWQRIAGTLVIGGLMALAYLAAGVNGELDDRGFHAFILCCMYTLLLLITCVISATCIAGEKEGETWTILLASPLSGSAIIWGKTLGVLRRLFWPMMLLAAHCVIFTMLGILSTPQMLIGIGVCVMFNTVWIATGVTLSLKFRKVTTAVIANLALPVLLYGAGSLVLAVIDTVFDANGDLVEQVLWYLPWGYLAEGIGSYRQDTRDLPTHEVTLVRYMLVALAVGVMHVALAAGLLRLTAWRFNAIVARAPQRQPS